MQAPGMDIRSAQYLVAVVDHGSVTAAADVLRISQPSLSQAVRNLERALGSTLFERTTRGLAPTTVGLAITDSARALLADVARAEAAVAAVTALRTGELAIAVQSDLAIDPVAEVAGRLHLTAPGIRFSTNAVPNAQDVRALVRAGTCELGFLETHPGTDVSDGLREIAVSTQETVLSIPFAWPQTYPIRFRAPWLRACRWWSRHRHFGAGVRSTAIWSSPTSSWKYLIALPSGKWSGKV